MPHLRRASLLLALVALASLIIANLACSQVVGLPSTPTRTMPMVECTAPACQPNESYYCPGSCPGGCGTTCATNTPGPTPTSHCPPGAFFLPEGNTFKCMTPTAWVPTLLPGQPQIMCTPPACRPDEVYYCPGQCPGGCGITCVTPTAWAPTPADLSPEAPASAPCLIVIRTPPPSAPTAVVDGTPLPGRRVDPHVEVCASATTVSVGQSLTLVGQVVDIGLPYFYVMVRPAGAGEFRQWLGVTYNNEIKAQSDSGEPLEVVSARGDMHQLVVVLRARSAGAVDVVVNATGEVHYGYPGPAMWEGGGSNALTLVVQK
jgi:hypothetical protein